MWDVYSPQLVMINIEFDSYLAHPFTNKQGRSNSKCSFYAQSLVHILIEKKEITEKIEKNDHEWERYNAKKSFKNKSPDKINRFLLDY